MRSTKPGLVGLWLSREELTDQGLLASANSILREPMAPGGGVGNPRNPGANTHSVESLEVQEAGCAFRHGLLPTWGQPSPRGASRALLGGMVFWSPHTYF